MANISHQWRPANACCKGNAFAAMRSSLVQLALAQQNNTPKRKEQILLPSSKVRHNYLVCRESNSGAAIHSFITKPHDSSPRSSRRSNETRQRRMAFSFLGCCVVLLCSCACFLVLFV